MNRMKDIIRPYFEKNKTKIHKINENEYQMINLESGKNFCIGEIEYSLLLLCNGENSIEDISGKNRYKLRENDVCRFILQAAQIGLIESSEKKQNVKQNILSLKLPLVRLSESFICQKKAASMLKKILYLCCVISLIYIGYVIKTELHFFTAIITTTNYLQVHNLAFYFLSFFVLAFVHENAHAVVLASYGVLPGRMGVMLNYFHPSCYVEVTGVNKVKSKLGRIQVWMAGVISQVCMFAFGLFLMLHVKINALFSDFLLMSCFVNFALMFFNLFYVIKLDGYHILCELFENRSLREDALSCIMGTKEAITDKRLLIYMIVGLVSLVYIPIFIASILTNTLGIFVENANRYIDIVSLALLSVGGCMAFVRQFWLRRRKRI